MPKLRRPRAAAARCGRRRASGSPTCTISPLAADEQAARRRRSPRRRVSTITCRSCVGVVRRGERLAEPSGHLAQALALGLELVEPRPRAAPAISLNARPSSANSSRPLDRDALAERAARDLVGGVATSRRERADDASGRASRRRAPISEQRGEQAEQEAALGARRRRRSRTAARARRARRRCGSAALRRRERPVARLADVHGTGGSRPRERRERAAAVTVPPRTIRPRCEWRRARPRGPSPGASAEVARAGASSTRHRPRRPCRAAGTRSSRDGLASGGGRATPNRR